MSKLKTEVKKLRKRVVALEVPVQEQLNKEMIQPIIVNFANDLAAQITKSIMNSTIHDTLLIK